MMTESRKTNYLLLFFGMGALFLAIFFESGVFSTPSKRDAQLEEFHRVTDAAQIWFVRPAVRGGGGDSFERLDFRQVGLTSGSDSLEWQGHTACYRIIGRSREQFILEVNDLSGQPLALDTLGFDTSPTLNLIHN